MTTSQGAQRQASAGARDGVKGNRRTLAARAPLHALVRLPAANALRDAHASTNMTASLTREERRFVDEAELVAKGVRAIEGPLAPRPHRDHPARRPVHVFAR